LEHDRELVLPRVPVRRGGQLARRERVLDHRHGGGVVRGMEQQAGAELARRADADVVGGGGGGGGHVCSPVGGSGRGEKRRTGPQPAGTREKFGGRAPKSRSGRSGADRLWACASSGSIQGFG